MIKTNHRGQGAVWVLIIIALIGVIALWIAKNPGSSISTTINQIVPSPTPTPTPSQAPTPSQSLKEIKSELDSLNTEAVNIDKAINDTQIDVMQ